MSSTEAVDCSSLLLRCKQREMNMLDATERGRPIMEYVYHLESMVRQYRSTLHGYRSVDRRWRAASFVAGFAVGGLVGFLLKVLLH